MDDLVQTGGTLLECAKVSRGVGYAVGVRVWLCHCVEMCQVQCEGK